MTHEELSKYVYSFTEGFLKVIDRLSLSLRTNSCLIKKLSIQAFILRNYIRMFSELNLVSESLSMDSYKLSDVVTDTTIVGNVSTITVVFGANTTTFTTSGTYIADDLASDIADWANVIDGYLVIVNGNIISFYSDSIATMVITVEDTISVRDYNVTVLDASYTEGVYQDNYNCIKQVDNKKIIDGVNIILNQNLKCN